MVDVGGGDDVPADRGRPPARRPHYPETPFPTSLRSTRPSTLHPLCITTLGGNTFKVDSWVAAKDIHVAIARAHPELGDPTGFTLLTRAGVRIKPGRESESRSALLSSQIPLQLILIMGTPNGEVGDAPTRHISIQFPKVSSQVHPK